MVGPRPRAVMVGPRPRAVMVGPRPRVILTLPLLTRNTWREIVTKCQRLSITLRYLDPGNNSEILNCPKVKCGRTGILCGDVSTSKTGSVVWSGSVDVDKERRTSSANF